ncbi:hypothetical protein BASA81_004161 [Batrachochytrium salamandrivorans]|nr:hypothetical protein BASA81_004161 [Batrachochytrium salamandrivorans]
MHAKGVMYIHLYDEGTDLDFNIGLYFYEQLVKRVLEAPEGAKWRNDKVWKPSMPEMQTAIVRKQELREKVDVDFDGRISFLEYLLYQYREFCNPADFVERSMRANVADDEAMIAAKAALEDVNAAIRAYQAEKVRLEELAAGTGVKALGAKNQLAQLNSSPLLERLQVALIKAEAAIRLATKAALARQESGAPSNQAGNMFWMNRELEQNKALYGRKN